MPSACGCRTSASALAEPGRRGDRPRGALPRQGRARADAGLARAAGAVGAEEEGAGARQGRRGAAELAGERAATRILMGVIGRPHGVRGLVRVHELHRRSGGAGRLRPARPTSAGGASRCAGAARASPSSPRCVDGEAVPVADRDAAAAADQHAALRAERDRLPAAEEDEYYLADLIGLPARGRRTGSALGTRRARCTTTAPAPAWRSRRAPSAAGAVHPRVRCRWWTSRPGGSS